MELYHLRSLTDPLIDKVKDDPVRPHIPVEQRVNDWAEILMLKKGEEVLAATCMAWLKEVPEDEQDLVDLERNNDVAVFYTIWSYHPGAGAELLQQAAEWLKSEYSNIRAIVTLSPQTDMARRFHLKNGARVRRENPTSVNYEYYCRD
jgi:hypothetical protein